MKRRAGKDGRKLVQGLWLLAYGTPEQRRAHFGEDVSVPTRVRLQAISELLDRGFGKPVQAIGVEGGPSLMTLLAEVAARSADTEQE